MTASYVAVGVLATLVAAVFVLAWRSGRGVLVAARMTAQAFSLFFFLFLLTQAVVPIEGYLALRGVIPIDLFMRMSPLLAASAMLAGRVFIAGMLLSVVTLATAAVAGRWFCGWICPLGTTLDASDRALFSRVARPRERDAFLRSAKYLLLAAVLAAAALSAQIAGWVDPMSIVTRSYAVAVLPAADRATKTALESPLQSASFRENSPAITSSLRGTVGTLKSLNVLYQRDHYYVQFGVFAVILLSLMALQGYQKRFWCRKLCPLGAMLGLAGKWRPLGVRLDAAKCIDCGKCRRICPVGAIQGKGLSTEECIFCGSCVAPCPVDALAVTWSGRAASTAAGAPTAGAPAPVGATSDGASAARAGGRARSTDDGRPPAVLPGRRAFLAATAVGALSAPALLVNTPRKAGDTRYLRPPGAQDEERFVDACVRCGACMKGCPQNALHPTGFEAGLAGLWTPRLVPTLGYCDFNCLPDDARVGNFCSTVCPTGAIKRLTPAEQKAARRGTAYFRTDRCIPYVERTECSVCVEHCPVPQKALKNEIVEVVDLATGELKKIQRPWVDKDLCIGCGQCEYVCPLKGERGIRVEPVRSLV